MILISIQVKGLFNGGDGGGPRNNRSNSTGERNWSPPPPPVDSLKKEVEGSGPNGPSASGGGRANGSGGPPDRDRSDDRGGAGSPVPSGRIAVQQGESPITHNLPIFPQQPYPRPFTSLPSIYPSFPFSASRPESTATKNSSTPSSVHSFPGAKSGGGGGGGRASASSPPPPTRESQFTTKLPLERVTGGDSRTDGLVEFGIKSELGKIRSPPIHRPSSEPYDRSTPRSSGAGSVKQHSNNAADSDLPPSTSPSSSAAAAAAVAAARRLDELERQRLKTEAAGGGGVSPPRERSFSGEFSEAAARDGGISRLSSVSKSSIRTTADAAEDLRTNDQEERIKRENNQDFLRRLAQVNSERENQLATIQKMDLLRQATARGDHFLAGAGGFSGPLSAPLTALPASDLARIAQSVPDPAAIPGEPTSGTGESSFFQFWQCLLSQITIIHFNNETALSA